MLRTSLMMTLMVSATYSFATEASTAYRFVPGDARLRMKGVARRRPPVSRLGDMVWRSARAQATPPRRSTGTSCAVITQRAEIISKACRPKSA
jgi:hypothetical protein